MRCIPEPKAPTLIPIEILLQNSFELHWPEKVEWAQTFTMRHTFLFFLVFFSFQRFFFCCCFFWSAEHSASVSILIPVEWQCRGEIINSWIHMYANNLDIPFKFVQFRAVEFDLMNFVNIYCDPVYDEAARWVSKLIIHTGCVWL